MTSPIAFAQHYAGMVGGTEKTYEVMVDNAKMQIHCHDEIPLEDIMIDVPLTRVRVIANVDGTAIDEFRDLPAGYPFDYQINVGGAVPPYPAYFVYPVDWDGIAVGTGDAFIPTPPSGYTIADCRHVVTGHLSGGTQSTIGDDTSGWGYHPGPTKTPYLVGQTSFGMSIDTFDGTEQELAAWLLTNDQYQSDLHIEHWYSSPPPPWVDISTHIVITDWKLRFRCVPE